MSELLSDIPAIDAEEMRDVAKRLLMAQVDRRAPYAEPPRDEADALFSSMKELGWTLLTLPERMEGLGQSFAALAPIYEEMGRAVSPVALFPSFASLELLALDSASSAAHELAVKVANGETQLGVAIVRQEDVNISGDGLNATLRVVPADVRASDLLLLVEGKSPAAWLIDLSASGVTVDRPEMWDRSRPVIDVRLEGAVGQVAIETGIGEAIARVRGHLDLALAWDSLGGTRQSLEETVGYMLTRHQFGRPIGSFQALKHRAADHKVAIEVAAALTREATEAYVRGAPDAAARAAQARLIANDTYHVMAEDAVQLHGGIGFTWEHDCHLFLKRALLNEMLFLTPEARRDALSSEIFARVRSDNH